MLTDYKKMEYRFFINFQIYTFPESFRRVVEEDTSSIFMFVADISTGIITGFKTQQKDKVSAVNIGNIWCLNPVELLQVKTIPLLRG